MHILENIRNKELRKILEIKNSVKQTNVGSVKRVKKLILSLDIKNTKYALLKKTTLIICMI